MFVSTLSSSGECVQVLFLLFTTGMLDSALVLVSLSWIVRQRTVAISGPLLVCQTMATGRDVSVSIVTPLLQHSFALPKAVFCLCGVCQGQRIPLHVSSNVRKEGPGNAVETAVRVEFRVICVGTL